MQRQSPSWSTRARRPATKRSILIIEDDPGIRQMLVLALEDRGYPTAAVGTVREARAAAHHGRPGVALVDLILEGASAFALIGELEAAGIPVIVMTAGSEVEAIASSAGATGWISKPFDLDEIYALAARYSVAAS